jgi:YVTN family beta-propeller protein
MKSTVLAGFACAAALAIVRLSVAGAAGATNDGGYRIVDRWPIGGSAKWDYLVVDAPHRRLFLSRSTEVQVIDLNSGKLAGRIADTPGVHGIALAQDLDRGFISNGKGDSVTVIALDTLATVAQIKISGRDPDAIVYDAPSKRVFTFNGHSNDATVIDAASTREIASIPLPGKPEFAVSDGQGQLFVNLEDKAMVARIDVAKGAVTDTWALAPCAEPTGIALDTAHQRLFSACHNQRLIVSDSATGGRIAELPIGSHVDAAAFDPALSLVFTSNGDSADVTVIEADKDGRFHVRGSLATAPGAKTMALDVESHRLYVPALAAGVMQVLVAAPN